MFRNSRQRSGNCFVVFNHSHMGKSLYLCPPTGKVGEYIVFGADPVGVRFFFSLHYLLNQFIDFDQTCKDTLFRGGKEFIKLC